MTDQQKSMIIGAILGAALGTLGGYLFSRGLDLPRKDRPEGRSVPPGELVRLFIAIMAVMRNIAELGERV